MSTALFKDIIFGPINSRRLGLSLGVNLLPLDNKLCSFECIYCECGWTKKVAGKTPRFNDKEDVLRLLEQKLQEMVGENTPPNVITFAGNGEPTMHPDFEYIINQTIEIRNRICPETKISVLSNATMLGRESVRNALKKVDNNILKLDSAFDSTVQVMDKPNANFTVAQVIENMLKFEGQLIIQTMFLRGEFEDQKIDNTTESEVTAWLELVKKIAPKQVMIYTIDRDTPAKYLEKVSVAELKKIAIRVEELGIDCSVAG